MYGLGIRDVGTGNWLGGRNSPYSGTDIISLSYDTQISLSGSLSNAFGRSNIITGHAYSTEVFGTENIISGYRAIVIGKENKISIDGYNSNIFGRGNVAFDDELFIFGSGNVSSGFQSYIVGRNNEINNPGTCSYVLGGDNYNNADNSVILGKSNTTYDGSDYTINLGYANTGHLGSSFGTILGRSNVVSGINSTIIGSGNITTGGNVAIFGYTNAVSSTANKTHIFGLGNIVSGADEVVVGSGNRNSGINSMVVGYGNTNNYSGTDANIFGRGNISNANRASIYGSGNVVSGNDSSTCGYNNQVNVTATRSHIFGLGNIISGRDSVIVGSGNTNNAINTFIAGYENLNNFIGFDSNIYGRKNISNTPRASIYGSGNIVSGADSATYGYGNQVFGDATRTHIFGLQNISYSRNQTIVGSGNINSGIDCWTVGNGNQQQTGTDNIIIGDANVIFSSTTGAAIFGNQNGISSNLTGVSIYGNQITLPLSGNAGYKLAPNNMNGAVQFGANNSGKITILYNGNIGIGTSGTLPFENPQELVHLRSGNALFDATEGGYLKFYDKSQYDNTPDNPSQRDQAGDIRAIVSGGNFKIDGDLVLSTGIGETGQFLAGRIFQEATVRPLDGSMWCYAVSDLQGNCNNLTNPYPNGVETIIGTDGQSYTHKLGLWQPTGLDLGWDTIGSPSVLYPSGYSDGYTESYVVKDGALARPDFCNGNCNFDYQPHEQGRIGGLATVFLDGNLTSALISGRYTFVHVPIMKTTNLYLPSAYQNSGVLYTVKNLGRGNIMVFPSGSDKIDLFFTGFMIDQRFASYEFLSNGSGWFLV